MSVDIDPTDWGWSLEENRLTPFMTDKDAYPENILNIVRYKCKSTWRKNGLKCVSTCGDCNRNGCSSASEMIIDEDDDEVVIH